MTYLQLSHTCAHVIGVLLHSIYADNDDVLPGREALGSKEGNSGHSECNLKAPVWVWGWSRLLEGGKSFA